jgi:hypothetical protein
MENHIKYSKGVCWISDCRIPFEEDDKFDIRRYNVYHDTFSSYEDNGSADGKYEVNEPNQQGRFTPNLLVCDDMLNDGSVSKSTKVKSPLLDITGGSYNNAKGNTNKITERGVDDKGTNSRYYDLDKWFDKIIKEL